MAGTKARGGYGKRQIGPSKGSKKRAEPDSDDKITSRATKKTKGDDAEAEPLVPKLETDGEGNEYVKLNTSGLRRVTVSDFNKSTYVNIREYYTADSGELKPGKKGISLSIEQYNALLAAAPLIESALSKKGVEAMRPDYDAQSIKDSEEIGEDESVKNEDVEKVEDEDGDSE